MLPRPSRLSRRQDITATLRQGRRIATTYAMVYVRPSIAPRAACIVGKRVYKTAVARHRLQRQLRQVARLLLSHLRAPHDMVIVARPQAANVKQLSQLQEAIMPPVVRVLGKRKN